MRNLFPRSIIALMAVSLVAALAFSSFAMAQAGSAGTKESLYNGNRLRLDPTPGGPAPIHDVNGSWAGNLTPERLPIPPMKYKHTHAHKQDRKHDQGGNHLLDIIEAYRWHCGQADPNPPLPFCARQLV